MENIHKQQTQCHKAASSENDELQVKAIELTALRKTRAEDLELYTDKLN